jgi:glycosyltransferase involved in cell wall biosynthesis
MDLRGTYKGGGGPDKTILNSAAQHDKHRVYVLVVYLRQPQDAEFQIPRMAAQLGIDYIDFYDGRGIDIRCLRKLRRLIQERRISIVHAHDDKTLLYGWILRLTLPSLRIMYTCHSHAVHGPREFRNYRRYLDFKLRQYIQIFLMKKYDAPILTVSSDTRRRLVEEGLSEAGVVVLHNGIDLRRWDKPGVPVLRREFGIPDGVCIVGTVARITGEKDLPTFYRVARSVSEIIPGTTFVVVGEGYGDELEKARQEVSALGLDHLIRFTGHRNDLLDVYASFDLFLMTSITEGMPNTLLEAMALGIPPVSTSVGGVPEVIEDGCSGYLAKVGDVENLASWVIKLLRDPELSGQIGLKCRERIEKQFSFEKRVRRLEDYYAFFAGITCGEKFPGSERFRCDG